MNDKAPFNLWDKDIRSFRSLHADEMRWVNKLYGNGTIGMTGWYMWIETETPPQPVPLTLGCMPVLFVGVGERPEENIPISPYPNPRIADPCPSLSWPSMTFPTREQNIEFLEGLSPLANIKALYHMPHWTVVELKYGDGRTYAAKSLPGIVAGRTTLYHHQAESFFKSFRSRARARRIDPATYHKTGDGEPQDTHNYLQESFSLTPGCRIECGFGPAGSNTENVNAATTLGLKLKHVDGREILTVAHHAFLASQEVFHPHAGADKIGRVIDTRPELDVAFVEMTDLVATRFTNAVYFQAEPPKFLRNGATINAGSWAEVDGMSSGVVSLMAFGKVFREPERPAGHPPIEFRHWQELSENMMFGAFNSSISNGMCGAPVVDTAEGGGGWIFSPF